MTRPILVGVIGAPHGVRGEVRLKSFTERPTAIADYGPLRSEDGRIGVTITSARALKDDLVVARLAGVTTREAAAGLTGVRLTMDRAALPPPEEEEFYHADLIGLAAETEDGLPLGQVTAVVNYGAGDILEIAPHEAGPAVLVAFTRAFVPVVDPAGRRLVVAAAALAGEDEDEDDGHAAVEAGPR